MLGKGYLSNVEKGIGLEGSLSSPVILMRRGLRLQPNVKVSIVITLNSFHFNFYDEMNFTFR